MSEAEPARMKLHWSPRSPYVRKVMVAAHETGLAGRLDLVRTVVAFTAPNSDLLPDNPLSKIPTLVLADGTALYDSLLICEYLDALHGGSPLVPRAGAERWTALRRHALGQGLTDLLIMWRSERDRPAELRSQPHLLACPVKAESALDALEREADALAGPFGIGQIAIACALSYADFRFADLAWRNGRDRLAAWHAESAARPSMRATEARDE